MAEKNSTKAKKKSLFEGEPKVTINIPVTRYEKDDVWVAVNGKSMQIKRGEDVEVPKCIYEALKHQEKMLKIAMQYEEAASSKASDKELA